MAQQSGNAMASSATELAPAERAAGKAPAHHQLQSMALVPSSSPTTNTALTSAANSSMVVSAAGLPAQTSAPQLHNVQEGEEGAWPLVTKALMVAVMGSQPPATTASTLLAVFGPMVEGWAAARKEGKRWKERAEVYMAEHHKHKFELAHKLDTLQAQVQELEQRLAESQIKVHQFESQQSTLRSTVSSLEGKLGEAEAQARDAKDAHAQEANDRKKEGEAMAKSAQDAKLTYEKLRQETDNRTRAQNAEITKLQDKIKENEAIKGKLEERLGSSITKSNSLEEQLSQRGREIANLQTRVAELTTRKEALERQLALYQRIPTRRY